MSHIGTENKLLITLFPEITPETIVLDIGHGYGSTGLMIRTKINFNQGWCKLWGLDIYEPYHELQKRLGIYDRLILCDAIDIPLEDKEVDYTIATHVIEHMRKEDGLKLIAELERVTKNRVILSTPNGFTGSGPLDDNEHNNHLSGWRYTDFNKLGYTTRIVARNVNSRLLQLFAKTVFAFRRKEWENEVLVAWKDLETR